jgi:hypothetical protein
MLYFDIDVKSIADISKKIVAIEASRIRKTAFFLIANKITPKKMDKKAIKIAII